MRKIFLVVILCCSNIFSFAQYKTVLKKVYSKNVKDSFEIYISTPVNYYKAEKYNIVYYCDADLKSGKKLRELIADNKKLSSERKLIFIGIGHIGNYHELRRRDFIMPFIVKGDTIPKSDNYGHIENFYKFLTNELFPLIEPKYNFSGRRTIIGHSLGGLFVFFCLFKNEGLFDKYIALSPALWIDNYSIYHFNKIDSSLAKESYLYFSSGSKETYNRILKGTNEMNNFLKNKKYTHLKFEYQVHAGKTHISQIPESLTYILSKL